MRYGVKFNKKIFLMFLTLNFPLAAISYPFNYDTCDLGYKHVHHEHNEASYQEVWCNAHNGVMEYENEDFTRVDCLTDTHAVEFDFANKWQESIGQALHYGLMTGKKPKVVLILDNPDTQMVYYKRVERLGKEYKFDTEYITDEILNLDGNGKCANLRCKCHKKDIHPNVMPQNIHTVA